MKRRTGWILVAAVLALSMGAATVGALALFLSRSGHGGFGSGSYLYLGLSGELPENPAASLGGFLEREPVPLRTLVASLDQAASDSSVKGILLRVAFLDAGWGRVRELRDAVSRFRASGKPAIAFVEYCGNKEYYLASACSQVYAVPTAVLNVSGLAAEVTFFRKTLDKLGIEAQFEAVGEYKSAPTRYTQTGLTDPDRRQINALLDGIYDEYVTAIAQGRGKTAEEVRAIIDDGPYDGKSALAAGLVDDLLFADEVESKLEGAERIGPGGYVGDGGFASLGRAKVALIYVTGEILPGESQDGPFGSFSGSDTVAGALREAGRDGSIRAIVLRVDSPGGSGTASEVIWREMREAGETKPVVVSMGDVAASGGYYIAAGAGTIVAQPTTVTGSIGVFGGKFSLEGLYRKVGIDKEILTRGRHAALFSSSRPWTREERQKLRSLHQSFYEDFVAKVAEARGKSTDEIDAVARGRVWSGAAAKEIGLVDALGGLDVALEIAKQKAGLPPDQAVEWVLLPKPRGLLDVLLQRDEDPLLGGLPSEVSRLAAWTRLAAEGGRPLARLPFDLSVY